MPIIYKTTCNINNKIYIGQSKHKKCSYFGSGKLLLLAIKKYGKENFSKEILIEGHFSQKELDELEVKYISEFNSTDLNRGYNIEKGGYGNTEKQNMRISQSNKGRILSDESKTKIANSKRGKTLSIETKNKMSNSKKGNSNRKGIKHKEEDKIKISNSLIKLYKEDYYRKKSSASAKKRIEDGKCLEGVKIISSKENQIKATELARIKNVKSVLLIDIISLECIIFTSLIDMTKFFGLKGNSQLIECLKKEKVYKKRYIMKYN